MSYTLLDHTGDIRIRVQGSTLRELFHDAALATMDAITERQRVEPREKVEIEARGENQEGLLVHWLQEILYYVETQNFLFRDFEIGELDEKHLRGWAVGEPIDLDRHELYSEIKAVTFHHLKIEDDGGEYRVEILFDI